MQKFENMDVIAALEAIMHQNTAYYQSDFAYDIKMLREAARSDQPEDKLLLWLSRPSGTFCFRERDVLLKDTQAYNTWKFCGEQTHDRILAYAVELTGTANGTLQGNLYAEKVNGVWEQRLRIHYNCVGTIEIPSALPLPTPDVSVNTRKGVVVNYAPCDVAI